MRSESFYRGYNTKTQEITLMGFDAARDKLNLDYPPGKRYTGSKEGFDYMQGEAVALADHIGPL